ncbi:hypothetical protein ABZ920_16870 [Streptomyces sp. NPDC046831]|uniref:hypothetical protein n=1 Tax=Streptomyces sp. NPDC046831 TaxID=3154805 RepID=UPI0033C8E42E
MSGWGRAVYDLDFGVVMMLVACNARNIAWRICGFMTKRVGVSAVFTPTVVRATGAVLGVMGIAIGTIRLVGAFRG